MSVISLNQIAVNIICLTGLAVLAYITYHNSFFDKKVKKYFNISILTTMIVIIAEICTLCFEIPNSFFRIHSIISNIIGFSFSPFIAFFLGKTFYNKKSKLNSILTIPLFVNVILNILSPYFGFIFFITSNNVYNRGNLFFIYVISYICSLAMLFIETIKAIKFYQNRSSTVFSILFVFILFGTAIQIFIPALHTTWICISFSIILYYALFCEIVESNDALTGLLNRHTYENDLKKTELKKQAVIIFFDIDDFKRINDTMGHQQGDIFLRTVAASIRQIFSDIGFCYRIGGDEYCVIGDKNSEEIIEEKIKDFIKFNSIKKSEDSYYPSVSVGYSFYNKELNSVTEAIAIADSNMYEFKQIQKKTSV